MLIRSQPAEYGFELNEFDPFFNFRATEYIVENGFSEYFQWHDDKSWYLPEDFSGISGRDTAKSNDANNPAVVPANNLTNPKITITVNEPITAGNNTVKSYKLEFPPNI